MAPKKSLSKPPPSSDEGELREWKVQFDVRATAYMNVEAVDYDDAHAQAQDMSVDSTDIYEIYDWSVEEIIEEG